MSATRPAVAVPALMLVTDRALCPLERLPEVVRDVVAAGVSIVQVREKDLPREELVQVVQSLRPVCEGCALLLLNGSVEAAVAGGADGMQLGEQALSVTEARRQAGRGMVLSRSVHDEAGAREAGEAGADMLVLGTIYPSRSHPGGVAAGLDLVRRVTRAVAVPVIGIGGITAANAGEVIAAGASGVAVISAILAAPDPAGAAAGLRRAIDRAWSTRGTAHTTARVEGC